MKLLRSVSQRYLLIMQVKLLEPPTSPMPQPMRWESSETTLERPATAFDDLSDEEFDAVLDLIYAPHDWPARDALGDDCC